VRSGGRRAPARPGVPGGGRRRARSSGVRGAARSRRRRAPPSRVPSPPPRGRPPGAVPDGTARPRAAGAAKPALRTSQGRRSSTATPPRRDCPKERRKGSRSRSATATASSGGRGAGVLPPPAAQRAMWRQKVRRTSPEPASAPRRGRPEWSAGEVKRR
jgi:hypothetical protein